MSTSSSLVTIISAEGRERLRQLGKDLWEYREVFLSFFQRDIKLRYKQTALGVIWVVLQPLFTTGAFSLIFGKIAKMPTDGLPIVLFYFAANIPWGGFSRALNGSAGSIEGNAALVTKIYFPRLLIPAAAVCSSLVDFFVGWLVFLVAAALLGHWHWQLVVMMPLLLALQSAMALGIGLVLAALNAQYRDVKQALGFITSMMMLATPVIYPSSRLPAVIKPWLFLNPMATVIDAYRACLKGDPFDWLMIGASLVAALLYLAAGVWFFRKREAKFADIL